jgi:uncharacterized protein YndB with AHSA1/START domain
VSTAADIPSRTVTVRRTFDFPRDKVFAAWIDPQAIPHWFGQGDTEWHGCSVDLRVGGAYRFDLTRQGRVGALEGVFQVVDPPERLVYSWRWDLPGRGYWSESQVTVEFREVDGGTEIVLTHEGLPGEQGVAFHTEGWNASFERLGELLG